MTKSNCKGCEEELYQAYYYQARGFHLVQSDITNLGVKGKHLCIMMVDDEGKIMIS